MKRHEHLFKIAEEECSEIAQRISKIMRFGATEIQPGRSITESALTNEQRMWEEIADLVGVLDMLAEEGNLDFSFDEISGTLLFESWVKNKKLKVKKFLKYAKKCGTLEED